MGGVDIYRRWPKGKRRWTRQEFSHDLFSKEVKDSGNKWAERKIYNRQRQIPWKKGKEKFHVYKYG